MKPAPLRAVLSHKAIPAAALAAAAFTVALLSGCGGREAEAVVTRRDIVATAALDGKVAVPPAANASILPPYQAPVERILVTVGKSVQKGDVLMQLAAPQNQAYYQQARQQLQQAQQNLTQARQQWEQSLRSAQKRLEQARETERQARRQAQQPPAQPSGTATVTEQTGLSLSQATANRKDAEQEVLDIKAQMQQAMTPYEQAVALAQQQFDDAQSGLKGAMVRTPIAGTVLSVDAQIGQQANPKNAVARVVNLDALTVHAALSKDLLDHVEHGDYATVVLDDFPKQEFPGTVRQVYTQRAGLLTGASYVAVVDFKNQKGQAKPGMGATAKVVLGRANDVLAVPSGAVFTSSGKPAVKLRAGGEWRTRVIETGLTDGEYTEVKSGLNEGDTVQANP